MNKLGILSWSGRYLLALVLAAAVMMTLSTAALAEAPFDDQYGSPLSSETADASAGSEDTTGAEAESGAVESLPETGGPLAFVGIAGLLAVCAGAFLLRRARYL